MRPRLLTPVVTLLAASVAAAQTSYPMITHVTPTAVQRGTTTEVTVEGRMDFRGTYQLLIDGPGVKGEIVGATVADAPPPARPTSMKQPPVATVKLKVTVEKDAPIGVREFRLATALGMSSMGQLVIVEEPVVNEKGDNNTPARANAAPLPSVICGRIEAAEDVDFFKFPAKAGAVITVEVFCARIQDKIHDLQKHADPFVSLHDATGRELAANDDGFFADPYLTYTIPSDGEYLLQVRDSKYDGDPRWVYAVRLTDKPAVSHVHPMAGNPGQTLTVEPVGSARTAAATGTVTLPKEPGIHEVAVTVGAFTTNPVAVVVSGLPMVAEVEPNDAPEQATPITLPCGITGRIGQKRDLDHFRFAGKKGQAIRFEVKARRFGTPLISGLDSIIDVLNKDGKSVAVNDDLFGKDSGLIFTPSADGEYVLRIRDLNSKGGDDFPYFIEADYAAPDFGLRCDPCKAFIGPGSSMAWHVLLARQNGFTGPVTVHVEGLPKGVTATPLTIQPAMNQGLIVLTAAADAPINASQARVIGTAAAKTHDGQDVTLTREAVGVEEIYNPGGGRNKFDVKLFGVAVTEPSDVLKVEVTPNRITLKPGEEVKLDVTITRNQGFDKSVSLDIPLRHLGSVFADPLPTGVKIVDAKSKTLVGTGTKGHIVLKADPTAAAVVEAPISVVAYVSINFVVKVGYASAVIPVTIEGGNTTPAPAKPAKKK